MVYRAKLGRLGTSKQPTVQPVAVPASVGGVNALDSYANMPPQDCIYTYNLMPVEYGLQLRKGWRKWSTGVSGGVRTLVGYESNTQNTARNRLWAVSENGIYDVTTDGTTSPTEEVSFATQSARAGFGTWLEYTNDASNHFLFYADYENGIYRYEEATGTWGRPSGWTYDLGAGAVAFPVEDVAFVMVHKLRIWVILKDSDDAWYLPPASISGQLVKFTFGAKMKYGGTLQGLWSWTLDGGDGVDDYLVAVGRGGDVMVYRGGDPVLDFELNGNWFVGATPYSRRIAAQYGSEMYVLSSFGITSMRDLLKGSSADNVRTSASAKINRILRQALEQTRSEYEWSIFVHPGDGFLQVVGPIVSGQAAIQYNRNLNTEAWGFWEGVPILCGESYLGNYYMGAAGDDEGEVWLYEGKNDDADLSGSGGTAIQFRTLTSFQDLGTRSAFKNVGLIRAVGRMDAQTSINLEAVYDYDVEKVLTAPGAPSGASSSSWDSAVWDSGAWSYQLQPLNVIRGAYGVGRSAAIGMRGSSEARIEVVSWDLMLQQGGLL